MSASHHSRDALVRRPLGFCVRMIRLHQMYEPCIVKGAPRSVRRCSMLCLRKSLETDTGFRR